jgi:biotin carboxyl carrier protein
MPPFDGDPLEAAPDSLAAAREALEERSLDTADENVFLVASAIVAGKNMDLNEGIRLLTGKSKIVLPFKQKKEGGEAAEGAKSAGPPSIPAPITTTVTVVENGSERNFTITIQPPAGGAPVPVSNEPPPVPSNNGTPVFSPFQGKTELVEVNVNVGDAVTKGQVVAAVEAMKAKHDVKAPCSGKVLTIDADIGADIEAGRSILTIGN